jgi:hypothetical protein
MSQPELVTDKSEAEEVVVVKPRFNVYTMMLLLALCAIIGACVLLYIELDSYTPENGGGRWPWDTKEVSQRTLDSWEGTTLA